LIAIQLPVFVEVLWVVIASLKVHGPTTAPSPVLPTVIVAAFAQDVAKALTTATAIPVLDHVLSGGMFVYPVKFNFVVRLLRYLKLIYFIRYS